MSTQTRERNYRKNPHTARFLQAFHAAAYGLPSDLDENAAERELAATGDDLLDQVAYLDVVDHRSPRQAELMESLVRQISNLDTEAGDKARAFQDGITERGTWTAGRGGNASEWISRMIAKVAELKAAAPVAQPTTPAAEVADGRYAIEHEGALKFYKVTNGRRAGMVFLDVQASDEWHAIRNVTCIREIVAIIAQDPHAALVRYGHEIGVCGMCGKVLTDEASRAAGIGPICRGRM